MSCYRILCHAMPCHVMSCHAMSCHVMACHAMSCHVMSWHAMPCHVMSCHGMPCHAMPCHVMSCHVMCVYIYIYLSAVAEMKPDGFKRAGPFARVLRVEPTFQMPLAAPAGFVRKRSRDGRGSNFVDFCRFTILLIQTRSIFPSADVFLFRKMMITLRHWNCFPIFSQAHLYIETDLCWANLCPSDSAAVCIGTGQGEPSTERRNRWMFGRNLGAEPPDIQINCYYWN